MEKEEVNFLYSKKALSQIITTVLMILLVIATISIVSFVTLNFIRENTERMELGFGSIDLKIDKSNVAFVKNSPEEEPDRVSMLISRTGRGELYGVKFIFYPTSGRSGFVIVERDFPERAKLRFFANFTEAGFTKDELTKVAIAPVFQTSSGKLHTGKITDEYSLGEIETIDSPDEDEIIEEDEEEIQTPPLAFTQNIFNKALQYGESLNYQISVQDLQVVNSFTINWTNTFSINKTGWIRNISTLNSGTYQVRVTINDSANNKNNTLFNLTISPQQTPPTYSTLRIFISSIAYNGNLGGLSGADQKCMSDSNKPSGGSGVWKALVGTSNRQVGGNDWVLKPFIEYRRADGTTIIGTTKEGAWFTETILTNSFGASSLDVWTGINPFGGLDLNCNNWTAGNYNYGIYGNSSSQTLQNALSKDEKSCGYTTRIYCVEQPACQSNPECNDGNPQTTNTCVEGTCQTTYNYVRIFVTSSSYNGNLGGLSGADQKCMSDSNKPSGGSGVWKALVGTSNRQVGQSNWVLNPNMQYRRADGTTIIFTTNASAWFPSIFSQFNNSISSIYSEVWTGLNALGNLDTGRGNCNNWQDNSGSYEAMGGSSTGTIPYLAFSSSDYECTNYNMFKIYCVEQIP